MIVLLGRQNSQTETAEKNKYTPIYGVQAEPSDASSAEEEEIAERFCMLSEIDRK
jgi:hypothetical protein